MKQTICIILAVCLLLLAGCGDRSAISSGDTAAGGAGAAAAKPGAASQHYLPEKLTGLTDGGEIPAESVLSEHNSTRYPLIALRGSWVLADVENTWTASATDKRMAVFGQEIECLPTELYFNNAQGSSVLTSHDMAYGNGTFQSGQKDSLFPATETFIYTTDENTLSIGFFEEYTSFSDGVAENMDGTPVDERRIQEIDYTMDWTGWKLTLQYDGVYATYVPEGLDENKRFRIGGFNDAAIADGYTAIDGILALDAGADGNGKVMLEDHKMHDASFTFDESGTASIAIDGGEAHTYTYCVSASFSGGSLILESGSNRAVYSTAAPQPELSLDLQSTLGDVPPDTGLSFTINTDHIKGLFGNELHTADGEIIGILGAELRKMEDEGFTINGKTDQLLTTGEISDEILLTYQSGETVKVKVANPYENPTPIGRLHICWYQYEATGGTWKLSYDYRFGETTYDTVYMDLKEPYEKTTDELHYIGTYVRHSRSGSIDDRWNTGAEVIHSECKDDIYLRFENGILHSIIEEDKSLIYHGLQDNVSNDDLDVLKPSVMEEIGVTRDTILDELQDAFRDANVDVDINAYTGEVTMDAAVLFEHNDYALTDSSKKYLDDFMKVYASVLLSDQFAGEISEIAIQGHTDTTFVDEYEDIFAYDMTLSTTRAEVVRDYCLASNELTEAQRALFESKVTATGYAYTDPVFDSEGNVDDAASRRVCFKFYLRINQD